MKANISYDAKKLNRSLAGEKNNGGNKETIIEKYLRENPTGHEKRVLKPAMWEDLEDLYVDNKANLYLVTDAILKQSEFIRQNNYMTEKFKRLMLMYERDLTAIVEDIDGFRKQHTVDGTSTGQAMTGTVDTDSLSTYFLLGEEYKEIGMRSVQLFQPIMLELTDISLSLRNSKVASETDPNVITDVVDKNAIKPEVVEETAQEPQPVVVSTTGSVTLAELDKIN